MKSIILSLLLVGPSAFSMTDTEKLEKLDTLCGQVEESLGTLDSLKEECKAHEAFPVVKRRLKSIGRDYCGLIGTIDTKKGIEFPLEMSDDRFAHMLMSAMAAIDLADEFAQLCSDAI